MLGAGAHVFAVWGYVIAHTTDSQVELNPKLLAHVLGMRESEVEAALAYLCKPDLDSRNPEHEGRRLLKIGQFAYRVVSHSIYRAMRTNDDKREYDRIKQREHRERIKEKTETKPEAYTHAEVNRVNDKCLTQTPAYDHADELMERIRGIGKWRHATSSVAEHALVRQLANGANPDKLFAALCRIFVWTQNAKFVKNLAEAIERWDEPAELWIREERQHGRSAKQERDERDKQALEYLHQQDSSRETVSGDPSDG